MNYVYTEKKYENGDLVKSLYIKEGNSKSVKIDQTAKLIFSIGKTKNNLQVKLFSFLDIYNSLFACDIILNIKKESCQILSSKSIQIKSFNNNINCTFCLDPKHLSEWKNLTNYILTINEKNIFYAKKFVLFSFKRKVYSILSQVNTIEEKLKNSMLQETLSQAEQKMKEKLNIDYLTMTPKDIQTYINNQLTTTMSFISEVVLLIQSITNLTLTMSSSDFFFCINNDNGTIKKINNGRQLFINLDMFNYCLSYQDIIKENVIKKIDGNILIFGMGDTYFFRITNNKILSNNGKFCVLSDVKENIYYVGGYKNDVYEGEGILYYKGEVVRGKFKEGVIEEEVKNDISKE